MLWECGPSKTLLGIKHVNKANFSKIMAYPMPCENHTIHAWSHFYIIGIIFVHYGNHFCTLRESFWTLRESFLYITGIIWVHYENHLTSLKWHYGNQAVFEIDVFLVDNVCSCPGFVSLSLKITHCIHKQQLLWLNTAISSQNTDIHLAAFLSSAILDSGNVLCYRTV